jgi:hypothetical protein
MELHLSHAMLTVLETLILVVRPPEQHMGNSSVVDDITVSHAVSRIARIGVSVPPHRQWRNTVLSAPLLTASCQDQSSPAHCSAGSQPR